MQRRAFLEAAAASLLTPVLNAGEQYDVLRATRQELIVLLAHPTLFNPRQDAQEELIRRGTEEIRRTQQPLAWKAELTPAAEMNTDVRLRLQAIIRRLTQEEYALNWKPRLLPEVTGYEPGEFTAMHPYFSALNAAIGGGIDCERLTLDPWRKTHPNPMVSAGMTGEPFWEFARRNTGNFTLWGEDGRLILDPAPDERLFAHDGALAGRLMFDECGGTIYLMTNPGMEFLGCRVMGMQLMTEGGPSDADIEPEPGNSSILNICHPQHCDQGHVTGLTLLIKTLGAPVCALSVREFTERRTYKLGPFTVTLHPQGMRTYGREGTVRHTLLCQITMERAQNGVFQPFQSRFFTAYGENGVQYSGKYGGCNHFLGGGEYLLSLPEPLTRLDIRVPDFGRASEMVHELKFGVEGER